MSDNEGDNDGYFSNDDYAENSDSESDSEIPIKQKTAAKPIVKSDLADSDSDVDVDVDEIDDVDIDEEDQIIAADEVDSEAADDDEEDDDDDEEYDDSKEPSIIKQVKTLPPVINSDNDSDDDEEIDEGYLQKFDRDINKNYIVDFHPECSINNYDEIEALTKVVRDANYIVVDPLHQTIPFLTKYEKTRILGQRAKQINSGARPFVKVPENVIEGHLIAELELAEKRIPFIIRRPLPGGASEYWNLKDLEIIDF